eukprot:3369914-Rhodomonas_salina.2
MHRWWVAVESSSGGQGHERGRGPYVGHGRHGPRRPRRYCLCGICYGICHGICHGRCYTIRRYLVSTYAICYTLHYGVCYASCYGICYASCYAALTEGGAGREREDDEDDEEGETMSRLDSGGRSQNSEEYGAERKGSAPSSIGLGAVRYCDRRCLGWPVPACAYRWGSEEKFKLVAKLLMRYAISLLATYGMSGTAVGCRSGTDVGYEAGSLVRRS